MRSIGLFAAVIGTLLLAQSCSDGAGTPPPDNTAPVANFDLPSCTLDQPCDFVSTSTDDDEVTGWTWDFNGDNTADASTASASYTYETAGTFDVSLTVFDAEGLSHRKTSSITIDPPAVNTPPTAGFTHTCNGLECTFTNTSTDAAPGTITTFAWTFGDNATSDQASPSHTYAVTSAKDFTVTLTVTDDEGATDAETQTITVTPAAPVNPPSAGFTHSCTLAACTFLSTSSDVAPGTIASYAWTFGDGGTAAVNNPSHTYSVTARTEFTVTLTVTDNDGWTDVETRTIAVDPVPPTNPPPTARFSYSCAALVCTFVNTSFDHGGRIAGQAWTFGDGSTATEATVVHTYSATAATQFTVTLTVTDNEGATAVTSQIVPIDPAAVNQPPTAGFTIWCYGVDCIFTSTSTDAAPGAIVGYAWNFGDGGADDWKGPSHTYNVTTRTTFPVTLTVTDNEGATAVVTKSATVTPVPAAAQGCTTIMGNTVDCVLDIPARSTLKVTLLGISCNLPQKVSTPPPVGDQLFISVCSKAVGDAIGIFGGRDDELWVYQAGTQARIWFTQGTPKPGQTLNPPAGQVSGTYPDWTISFEDGDHPGAVGEPDFSDVVIGVHATAR
jgi:PKD repeat protein